MKNALFIALFTLCVSGEQVISKVDTFKRPKAGTPAAAAAVKQSEFVTLKPLPYALNALEPVMTEEQLTLHYTKHHQGYADNLNKVITRQNAAFKDKDLEKYVGLAQDIEFLGGGFENHEFFWESLAPTDKGGGVLPDAESELSKLLVKSFGSTE